MSRLTPATRRRALLAVLLLGVMALAMTASAPTSEAAPSGNCTYYRDASKTTVVGQYGYDCCNNRVAWGVKTAYSTCGGCFICFPPPRD
ncbi:MAG TPA: DUF6289 family protein [Thermoanaerobaculia bacterium]|nr:DUF6289 family protein [Thermoanaerobaculia bacterium]